MLNSVAAAGSVEVFALVRPSAQTMPVAHAGTYFYFDEMGVLKDLPVNRRAAQIAASCGLDVESPFLGDVFIGRVAVQPTPMRNAPFALAPPRAKDMWEDLRAGCLLVARDHDRFSEKGGFRKSVILVLELTRTQAVGVCLASALGETAARQGPMWKDVDDDVKAAAEEAAPSTIHWRRGGPVGGGRIGAPRFLVVGGAGETLRLDDGSAVDVLGGLRADDLPEALAEADHAVAVYKGYCRWGRQQLAQEFEGGDWDIVDSQRDDVAPQLIGEGLWTRCRRRINTS